MIKKTRNLFVLNGNWYLVNKVLIQLQFKGLTVIKTDNVSEVDIQHEFANNKSVVCTNVPKCFNSIAINIFVTDYINPSLKFPITIDVSIGNIAKQFETIANNLGCDIGDHKSNSSGLIGKPTVHDCPYCQYIKYGYDVDINLHRTLYKSEHFFVIPTVGEFIKGYLLIIPIEHIMSNAELNSSLIEEFYNVLDDVVYMLKLTYNISSVLVWENGSGSGGIGKAKNSIVHAHTHVAPSQLDADTIESISGFPLQEIFYEDLYLYKEHSYLLLQGKTKNKWKINNNPNMYIPRQYIRQILVNKEYIDLPDYVWDWRTYPFYELIKETCIDISTALVKHWDELPERIKQNTKNFCF